LRRSPFNDQTYHVVSSIFVSHCIRSSGLCWARAIWKRAAIGLADFGIAVRLLGPALSIGARCVGQHVGFTKLAEAQRAAEVHMRSGVQH